MARKGFRVYRNMREMSCLFPLVWVWVLENPWSHRYLSRVRNGTGYDLEVGVGTDVGVLVEEEGTTTLRHTASYGIMTK